MKQILLDDVPLLEHSLMEKWHVPFVVNGMSKYEVSYYPEFADGKLHYVYITDSGIGNSLEASSHEIAHIIDLSFRGQLSRLEKDDYGMSFGSVANPNKSIMFEAKVLAIQAKLLRIAGFPWDMITHEFDQYIVPSLNDIDAFGGVTLWPECKDIICDAKKLRTATLFKHWQNATNYLKALM